MDKNVNMKFLFGYRISGCVCCDLIWIWLSFFRLRIVIPLRDIHVSVQRTAYTNTNFDRFFSDDFFSYFFLNLFYHWCFDVCACAYHHREFKLVWWHTVLFVHDVLWNTIFFSLISSLKIRTIRNKNEKNFVFCVNIKILFNFWWEWFSKIIKINQSG